MSLTFREKDGWKLKKLALKGLAVVAISVTVALGGAQGAMALSQGSFQCIPKSQDFLDQYGNHNYYQYVGAKYSAGHGFYEFHHWTYPFDNGYFWCQA